MIPNPAAMPSGAGSSPGINGKRENQPGASFEQAMEGMAGETGSAGAIEASDGAVAGADPAADDPSMGLTTRMPGLGGEGEMTILQTSDPAAQADASTIPPSVLLQHPSVKDRLRSLEQGPMNPVDQASVVQPSPTHLAAEEAIKAASLALIAPAGRLEPAAQRLASPTQTLPEIAAAAGGLAQKTMSNYLPHQPYLGQGKAAFTAAGLSAVQAGPDALLELDITKGLGPAAPFESLSQARRNPLLDQALAQLDPQHLFSPSASPLPPLSALSGSLIDQAPKAESLLMSKIITVTETKTLQLSQDVKLFQATLEPANLGAVSLRIHAKGERLHVQLAVETPEALNILRFDEAALTKVLRAAAVTPDNVTLQVSLNEAGLSTHDPARQNLDSQSKPFDSLMQHSSSRHDRHNGENKDQETGRYDLQSAPTKTEDEISPPGIDGTVYL